MPEIPQKIENLSDHFSVFYPEMGTMPSSHASCNFKPVEFRSNEALNARVPISNNTRAFSQNNSLTQENQPRHDNTLSIQ